MNNQNIRNCLRNIANELHTLTTLLGEPNEPVPAQASPALPTTSAVPAVVVKPAPEPVQTSELVEKLRRDYQYTHNWAETAHKFGLKKAEAVRLAHTAPPTSVLYPGMAPDRIYNTLRSSKKPMTLKQLISALEANGGAPKPGTLSAAVNSLRYQGRLKSVKLPRRKGARGRPALGYTAV